MEPLTVFVGWDERDALAYEVCVASMRKHSSVLLNIIPLKHWELRAAGKFWREWRMDGDGQIYDQRTGEAQSTTFSLTRYCSMEIAKEMGERVAVFCDPDILWRGDIAAMVQMSNPDAAVSCVHHNHYPPEARKMTGTLQTQYERKNWSSVMVLRPGQPHSLTPYRVNMERKDWLHSLCWSEKIGQLGEGWNWLAGWSSMDIDPSAVHFTRGTPDMPGHENEPFADEWLRYASGQT